MINPELSHRIARVSEIMMNNGMTFENKRKLYKILNKINSFDNLPDVYKSMILRAEDDIQKQNSNDFLKAAVQSAFEIALKTDVSKIKFNWNCKDSEKNGTGPGSCKDADDSKSQDTGPTAKTKLIPITTKFSEELTDSESDSLRSYSTDSYSYISAFLNTGDASKASGSTFSSSNKDLAAMAGWIESLNFNEDNVKGAIYHIDNAMQKSKTNLDGIVYSGLGKEKNAQIANMKVGDTTTFKGYTSASKRLNVTGFFVPQGLEKNIVLKIRVPKGTNAIDMEKFANQENRKQYEVLLHKGITYKKVGEKEGSVSYRGTKIPVSIVEVEVTNPIDDSPRIDWKPDTMTSSEHKKEYDNSWKSAYDSVENGMKSITIPEKMADPFRRYKTRTISVGDEIEYTPDMYSESKTSKIVGFKPTTEKTPNGKIAYKVDAIIESGESVDLSKHKLRKERNGLKQNSIESIAQKAFEIALKSGSSSIKLNWNCKDSEKNGTGPGSCKDSSESNTKSKVNKNPKSSPKPVKVGTYAKIYANKSPKAFPNQLYIVRMGEEDESQYNTKGNQFYGTNLDQLIQKALDSSKDSGRLIIGRVGKDKLDDNDLKDALNNNLEINPGYLSSMVAPVDTVIDTASGDTIYKRSQEKLDEEHAKYIESEEFDKQLNQNTAISEYRNFGYQSINTVLRGSYVTDKSQKTSILDSRDVIPEDVVMKTKERIAHIHEAMMPLPKGTTLYRVDGSALTATLFESLGITKELNAKFSESGNNRPKTEDVQQNAAYWNKYLTDKLKDSEFQDLGFSSTSKGRAHISNDLLVPTTELSPYGMPSLLEISTPKGTRSIDVQERIGVGEGRYKEEKEVILDSGTKFKVKSVEFKFRGNEMYTHIKVDALQDQIEEKQNSIQNLTQTAFESALKLGINKIKFNANCPESEKVGTGPGSCGGSVSKGPVGLSKKSEQLLKKYKTKDELKKAKTSIMASLVKSTKDPKTSLENAKINVSIFKGMTAEEADELTGDAAQEHTNWLMDKGPYYDIKQGISEPMLEDTEELHKRGWNVNGTYHPDIPKKSILDDAAAKIFTYKDEQGRFHKNAELIDAVEEYTGDLYDMYNKVSAGNLPKEFLKLTPEDQKELKDRIDNFAAALNTAELPEPVVTYRGIRETTLKRLEQLGASEIGSEFQINYFQSTTLNYETTKSFMGKDSKGRSLRIQIKLPKGTPAAYVDGFSANNGEDEVLVNRNLKYRCIDVKETDATKTLVWEAIL
jgi:hypothetical protein